MEPLKEYCKLKPMSGEERSKYFLLHMSTINDSSVYIKVLNDFIHIFEVLDDDENAGLMATFERLKLYYNKKTLESKKEQAVSTDTPLLEARIIPLFPKSL